MKKVLVFAIITLVSISMFSQLRVNREEISFISESEKITEAIGWYYSEYSGKWADNQNFIHDGHPNPSNKAIISKTNDNFNFFQFKKLKYESQTYYALFINFIDGYYDYPEIHEDWHTYEHTHAYIYTKEEYDKIKLGKNIILLRAISDVRIFGDDEINGVRSMIEYYQKRKSKSFYEHFPIQLEVDGDDSVIRFLLPNNPNVNQKSLETRYYEMKKTDFMKILID